MLKLKLTAVVALIAGGLGNQIFAQVNPETSPAIDSGVALIADIDQRIKVLERLREVDAENNQKKLTETPVVIAGKDGFIFRAPDTSYQLRIRYEGHFDGRYFADSDTFSTQRQAVLILRRARPIIEARLPGSFSFRLMADLGSGKIDVPDAYLESGFSQKLGIRIGKFKSPFSSEILQSTSAVPFLELSLASQLAPNRDIGAQLQGEIGNGFLSYALGVFNGVADGSSLDADWNQSKDVAGRVFIQPFQNLSYLKGFGIGGAFTSGRHSDHRDPKKWSAATVPASVSGLKTAGQESFFKYRDTTYASGNQTRYSVQGSYYIAALGITGEYISSTIALTQKTTRKELTNSGWNVAATYAITGEAAGAKGLKPFRNFNPLAGEWGALELAGRVSSVEIDKQAFLVFADSTKQATSVVDYTGGINWHLNRNIKVLLDYTQTQFTGGAKKGDALTEKLVAGRVQLVF